MKRYRYLSVEKGVLTPKNSKTEIDTSKYKLVDGQRRFIVSQHTEDGSFLIDVGFRDTDRVTIVCDNMGELLHALAIVQTAFPRKIICKS